MHFNEFKTNNEKRYKSRKSHFQNILINDKTIEL